MGRTEAHFNVAHIFGSIAPWEAFWTRVYGIDADDVTLIRDEYYFFSADWTTGCATAHAEMSGSKTRGAVVPRLPACPRHARVSCLEYPVPSWCCGIIRLRAIMQAVES